MQPLYFFGRFVQKVKECYFFSDSFCQFLSQQSKGSHYVTDNPQLLHKNIRKNLFISANTYEKYIVWKDYCIAHHGDKTCFLPAGKYHIILLANVEELLKKLDTFCFSFQHVDCMYTLFKYRFSIQWKRYCKEWTSV